MKGSTQRKLKKVVPNVIAWVIAVVVLGLLGYLAAGAFDINI